MVIKNTLSLETFSSSSSLEMRTKKDYSMTPGLQCGKYFWLAKIEKFRVVDSSTLLSEEVSSKINCIVPWKIT